MAIIQDSEGNAYSEDNPLAIAIAKILGTLSMNHEYTDNTQWKQTHNAVSVGASSTAPEASFSPVPDGMTDFINNITIDGSIANVYTNVQWSEDGTISTGFTPLTVSNTFANTNKTSDKWFPVGGAFYKVVISNGDAASHICSANIKFRP